MLHPTAAGISTTAAGLLWSETGLPLPFTSQLQRRRLRDTETAAVMEGGMAGRVYRELRPSILLLELKADTQNSSKPGQPSCRTADCSDKHTGRCHCTQWHLHHPHCHVAHRCREQPFSVQITGKEQQSLARPRQQGQGPGHACGVQLLTSSSDSCSDSSSMGGSSSSSGAAVSSTGTRPSTPLVHQRQRRGRQRQWAVGASGPGQNEHLLNHSTHAPALSFSSEQHFSHNQGLQRSAVAGSPHSALSSFYQRRPSQGGGVRGADRPW